MLKELLYCLQLHPCMFNFRTSLPRYYPPQNLASQRILVSVMPGNHWRDTSKYQGSSGNEVTVAHVFARQDASNFLKLRRLNYQDLLNSNTKKRQRQRQTTTYTHAISIFTQTMQFLLYCNSYFHVMLCKFIVSASFRKLVFAGNCGVFEVCLLDGLRS